MTSYRSQLTRKRLRKRWRQHFNTRRKQRAACVKQLQQQFDSAQTAAIVTTA